MTQRVWQLLATALAVVLLAIGGLATMVFVDRTSNQARATPMPRTAATARPSPSGSGIAAASSSGGAPASGSSAPSGPPSSGSLTPSSEVPAPESPLPSVSTSPAASVGPTPRAAASDLRFVFEDIALDDADDAAATSRSFTFFTDGPGNVRASIASTGGITRLCVHRGSPTRMVTTPLCVDGRTGFVRQPASGQRLQWTLVLSGRTTGQGPVTDLTVDFRGREARVTAAGLRLGGTVDEPGSGLVARFTPRTNGPLLVDATVASELGGAVDHQLVVRDLDTDTVVLDQPASEATSSASVEVTGGNDHRVELRGAATDTASDLTVEATLAWP
jgi:hypothetical protein